MTGVTIVCTTTYATAAADARATTAATIVGHADPGFTARTYAHAMRDASRIGRADAGTRTPDPIITSDVLYQLSYVGRGSRSQAGV